MSHTTASFSAAESYLDGGYQGHLSATASKAAPFSEGTRPSVERFAGGAFATAFLVGLAAHGVGSAPIGVTRSPTVIEDEAGDFLDAARSSLLLDEAQSVVRDFSDLRDGWDGPESVAPSLDVVEDALVVLQQWAMLDSIPEPAAGADGTIALELYDTDGFTKGGIELIGNHTAVFSVVERTQVLAKGRFNALSTSEVVAAVRHIKGALG